MKKLLEKTDLLAGIFAVMAFVAIICEIIFGGFTKESIVGGIKDITGILVDVLVLIVATSVFVKKKSKDIVYILDESIKKWGNDNVPLVFKVEGFKQAQNSEYTQGFALLQNPREYVKLLRMNLTPSHPEWSRFASYSSKETGKFIDMPSAETMTNGSFDICVVMNQTHFKNMPDFENAFINILECVKDNCQNGVEAFRVGKELKIKIKFENKIQTKDDIKVLTEVLDYIVSLVKVVA